MEPSVLLILFWSTLSIGTLISGLITLFLQDSPYVPEFVLTLVLYGKFSALKSSSSEDATTWKPFRIFNQIVSNLEVPKRWFRHFYLLSFMATMYLIIVSCWNTNPLGLNGLVLILFGLCQCSRRIYETFFVSIYSGNTINLFHYLVGLMFYLTVNYAIYDSIQNFGPDSDSNHIKVFMLILVFMLFSWIQFKSHVTLANLRKNGSSKSYHVPRGGLFEYVACPHYLSEIIIYTCLYEIGGRSLLWLVIWLFVIINQTIGALLSYRWYREHFGHDHHRPTIKALVPFVL